MGIYVPDKCWKFRLKFPIRLGENQIFVVVRFFSRTLYIDCRPTHDWCSQVGCDEGRDDRYLTQIWTECYHDQQQVRRCEVVSSIQIESRTPRRTIASIRPFFVGRYSDPHHAAWRRRRLQWLGEHHRLVYDLQSVVIQAITSQDWVHAAIVHTCHDTCWWRHGQVIGEDDAKYIALGTLRHQDTSALNYSAEVSGHFGTSAEVSRHFGTDLYETLWHHCIFV